MKKARLFNDDQGQAVCLPEEFRFLGEEVLIKRVGRAVFLLPLDPSWGSLIDTLDLFSDDFMWAREQPTAQPNREPSIE